MYPVTRALIPALLKSPTRTLLTVGSAAGHLLETGLSVYEASKFANHSQGLRGQGPGHHHRLPGKHPDGPELLPARGEA